MKVTQALKVKCVMGELTLGDVLNLISSNFSYVCVEQNGSDMGRYDNWCITKKCKFNLYYEDDSDFSFDLKTKVKIKNDTVEWDEEGVKTCLQFLKTNVLELGCLLP